MAASGSTWRARCCQCAKSAPSASQASETMGASTPMAISQVAPCHMRPTGRNPLQCILGIFSESGSKAQNQRNPGE